MRSLVNFGQELVEIQQYKVSEKFSLEIGCVKSLWRIGSLGMGRPGQIKDSE